SDQYDILIKNILQDDRLRDQYYNCFLHLFYGNAPGITADAKFFKEIASEALQSKCKRCKKQKETLNLIMDWYTKNKPEQWKASQRNY
ncbi:hypothetical protein ALC53_05188, partial [Atta colombica]